MCSSECSHQEMKTLCLTSSLSPPPQVFFTLPLTHLTPISHFPPPTSFISFYSFFFNHSIGINSPLSDSLSFPFTPALTLKDVRIAHRCSTGTLPWIDESLFLHLLCALWGFLSWHLLFCFVLHLPGVHNQSCCFRIIPSFQASKNTSRHDRFTEHEDLIACAWICAWARRVFWSWSMLFVICRADIYHH